MHILITGGAGYIGSHTALVLLQQGHTVTLLDHLEKDKQEILDAVRSEGGDFELLQIELKTREEVREKLEGKTFDAVIHFAASIEVGISTKEPIQFVNNNVVGSQHLFEILIENGVKNFVFSSSAAVYGTPESVPIKEDDRLHPENPYALTKHITEQILESYTQFAGINVVALRYFNPAGSYKGLIGERHKPETHLIPRLLHGLISNDFKLKIFGNDYDTPDGTPVRDYIHVMDLADAHAACIEYLQKHTGYSAFNVGTGQGSSIMDVIDTTEEVTGKKVEYEMGPRREGDSPQLVADPTKIRDAMGWTAKYTLEDIISSAWEWEQKRTDADYA